MLFNFAIVLMLLVPGTHAHTSRTIPMYGTAAHCVDMANEIPNDVITGMVLTKAACVPTDEASTKALQEYRFSPKNRANLAPPLMDSAPTGPRATDRP